MASDQQGARQHPQTVWGQTELAPANNAGDQRQIQIPTLNEEEKLAMKECDRDSFYQRALPLSLGSMFGAHMLVRSGRWKPHPKMGSLPKVLIFGGVGFFFGKVSYLPVCQQKILEKIPNSNLAAAIRKSRGLPESENLAPAWNDAAGSAPSSRIRDDYSAPEGLDDRFRPTLDREGVKGHETPPQEKSSASYEELRRRNRQEYESQTSKSFPKTPGAPSYKDSPLMPQKPWPDAKSGDADSIGSPSPPLPPPPPRAPSARKRTNIWGDPIDE